MKGLKLPVGVTNNGGAATVNADENDQKIIMMALSSGHNENAFQQDLSLGESMIFDLNDPNIRAKITRKLYKMFETFRIQKRFELKKNTIQWSEDSENQELILEFEYLNLESDEDILFRRAYTSAD